MSKNYRYNVYNISKMKKIINKKLRIKIIIFKIRIYIDFAKSYSVSFIIDKYKKFVTFINKVIAYAQVKFFNSKLEIKSFLIHNYKALIVKNYKSILFI